MMMSMTNVSIITVSYLLAGGHAVRSALAFTSSSSSSCFHHHHYPHCHVPRPSSDGNTVVVRRRRRLAARYGPKEDMPTNMEGDFYEGQEAWEDADLVRTARQRTEFSALLERIVEAETPEALPSLMTDSLDLVLSMRGYEGTNLFREALEEAERAGEPRLGRITAACDYVLTFTEAFVEHAKDMDHGHKTLLGKILTGMTSRTSDREEDLDALLQQERENFTPGFLRHVEGECTRIETAPRMSRESGKMLQTLRIVQTRVVEELGAELGEGAQILGQLLGYDDRDERIAVLETGLTVRGINFAKEMLALTDEALAGFKEIPGAGVDPELVERVTDLNVRIAKFIGKTSSWE